MRIDIFLPHFGHAPHPEHCAGGTTTVGVYSMSHRAFRTLALALGSLFLFSPASIADPSITLDARLAQPVMKEGTAQKNYLRVSLGGCRPEPNDSRTPVNVAFVIDRSGSMAGDRIAQAREAAIMAIGRLGPEDIASVVVFDTRADVLIPGQKGHRSRTTSSSASGASASAAPPPSPTACSRAAARCSPTWSRAGSTASCCCRTGRPTSARRGWRISSGSARACCTSASRSAPSASASATTKT